MDRPLPDDAGVWLEMRDGASFAEAARIALRGAERFERVHDAMGALAREIRRCIGAGDDDAAALRLLRFVETAVSAPRAPTEFANAVAISFVDLDELRALDLEALESAVPTVLAILRRQAAIDAT